MHPSSKLAFALGLLATSATPALAAWPHSPFTNLPLCTTAGDKLSSAIVSDGAGGAIVTWQDSRGGAGSDIYAQHVLASGTVDPAWPADGRALCAAANNQENPTIVSDGAGGAIVSWQDLREGTSYNIYAQHVLAGGTVDPAWPPGGRALCTAAGSQFIPAGTPDGAGGAIVTWLDDRGAAGTDIYAHHVLASGAVDGAWPSDGRALCTAANDQDQTRIVSDGAGGAIVTWQDFRGGLNHDIYAQHVRASGAVDGAWPPDGRALCTTPDWQLNPRIVTDGAGGAIVTWEDIRSAYWAIYAQHVLAGGGVDPGWPADGRALSTGANNQQRPAIISDGAGGAIIAWDQDSLSNVDIHAQHVLASGALDPAWPADGCALTSVANTQWYASVVSDGAGGAVAIWGDNRNGNWDLYTHHVQANGAVDAAWPVGGRAFCTAPGTQGWFAVVSDGAGGAVAAWSDFRGGNWDIYAQRVARYGYLGTPEAEMAGVKDVPNDNGGKVKVSWTASYLDLAQDANLAAYDVLRSVPPNFAAMRLARGEHLASSLGALGNTDGMIALPGAAQGYYWELLASVNALHYVSGYSMLASTAFDSLGAGNPKTAFLVVARNAGGSMFWPSRPDSGYSVDNVPPVTPTPFTANYATGTAHLHWNPNTETDLANYRLYRGVGAFTPSPATLIASPPDTGWTDAASATYTYKLTAMDVHGNESPVATITPAGITGVDGGIVVRELALSPASPNPASRGTTLRFALPTGARVSLGVYDPAGRLVRSLASGALPAGEHAATWDLRDGAGHVVGAGLYFARLDAGGRTLTRRIAVTP